MRGLWILFGLMVPMVLNASDKDGFQQLTEAFVEEYQQLDIAPLQLSYVGNLEAIPSEAEVRVQAKMFRKYELALQKIDPQSLSADQKLEYQVLQYEIALNLERIDLEKRWHADHAPITGNRIYDESLSREWYCYYLKKWVDQKATPDEMYTFGLAEIEKVKAEMKAVRRQLKKGEEQDDYTDPKAVQHQYENLRTTINQKAKDYFPNVAKIPAVKIARGQNEDFAIVPAFYTGNTFYYNFFGETYDPKAMGWTYLHEAIPGHHYQNHLNAQVDRSPVLDLFTYYCYKEGWGAYVEQFGYPLDAFQSPYDHFGLLEWDLIRSVRVAMDVGLNYYGWSDEEALEFWQMHIKEKDEIGDREIKRMKRWPAQVITYKYGKNVLDKLKGNRTSAEELKAFHWSVLKRGELPLSVLQEVVEE